MRRLTIALVVAVAATVGVPLAIADSSPPEITTPGTVTEEATGPGGATVSYTVTVSDDNDPNPTLSCSPSSGSLFPLGTTTVECTAGDLDGNTATAGFGVTVQDTTPPSLEQPSAPAPVPATSAAGAPVPYDTPSATDAVSTPTVGCSPASGSTFPIGTTTVTCTATDGAGNSASKSMSVTVVDTTAPVLTVPGNIVREATGPGGASVTFAATATDWSTVSVSCTPSSGSTFPLGLTTVSCTATDGAGNSSAPGTFTVRARDTIAPAPTLPAPISVEATSPSGAAVTYTVSATDAVDTTPTVACTPLSGSTFPIGTTTVNCTATDDAGNSAGGSFTVTVRDTTAPVIATPGALVVEANGPAGSKVTYTVTASDAGSALLPASISCAPTSGSTFPLGTTVVSCTATDLSGNTGAASFSVLVQDTTAPSLLVADVTLGATSKAGARRTDPAVAAYLRSLGARDLVTTQPRVTTNAPDLFPVGKTPLEVQAVDDAGNGANRVVTVTVLPLGQAPPPPPDLTPPNDVSNARAVAGDRSVALRWVMPAQDAASVEIRMSIANTSSDERAVYRGIASRTTITRLTNGTQYRFVLITVDKAGNRSRGVVVLATPAARTLAAPRAGARVTRPPLLRWVPVPGASYFNVQLYRGKTKLLSVWPTVARLQLRATWTFDGVKRRLTPGTYTWYVWPGLGARAEARYGPMLGKSSFTVVKPKPKPKTG